MAAFAHIERWPRVKRSEEYGGTAGARYGNIRVAPGERNSALQCKREQRHIDCRDIRHDRTGKMRKDYAFFASGARRLLRQRLLPLLGIRASHPLVRREVPKLVQYRALLRKQQENRQNVRSEGF